MINLLFSILVVAVLALLMFILIAICEASPEAGIATIMLILVVSIWINLTFGG